MSEPIQGELYTIKKDDTLRLISQKAYGDYKDYILIFNANRDIISNEDRIFPGQTIKIPLKEDLNKIKNQLPEGTDVAIAINGSLFKANLNCSIETSIDGSYRFMFSTVFNKDVKDKNLLNSFFNKVQIFIGKNLILTGFIEKISRDISSNAYKITLEGRSITSVLQICKIYGKTGFKNKNIKEIIKEVILPYGIMLEVDEEKVPEINQNINYVSADDNSTIWEFLKNITKKANVFFSSSYEGNLRVLRIEKNPEVILNIDDNFESKKRLISISYEEDSSKIFSDYEFTADVNGRNISVKKQDKNVKLLRYTKEKVDNITSSKELTNVADFIINKNKIDSKRITLEIQDWLDDSQKILEINKGIKISLKDFDINEVLTIQSITFSLDSNRRYASLEVVKNG